MLSITPALLSHLSNSSEYRTVETYRIELTSGSDLLLTSHDRAYGGYAPAILERSLLKRKKGLEVEELEIAWTPSETDLVLGLDPFEAALGGALDDAKLAAAVVFLGPDWQTEIGTLTLFVGWIRRVVIEDLTLHLTAKNLSDKLAVQVPRCLYTAGCQWRVYSEQCGVNPALYVHSVAITSQSGRTVTVDDLGGAADHYYDLGTLTVPDGRVFNILRQVGLMLTLLEVPLVSLGSSGTVHPGCDLTKTTCETRFNNLARYRGFPFIPEPEVAMYGAATTGAPLGGLTGAAK